MNPAIFFEPDAFLMDGPKLMGRQSAGNGFLRAAVRAHGGQPIHAVTAARPNAEAFARAVRAMDPKAKPHWIPASRFDKIAERGVLYRPDLNLAVPARERLRFGAGRYSLCGVTHTLCTHGAADALADLLIGPLMPWDALVCTSTAARANVEAVARAQVDYLTWRFGTTLVCQIPQLPVIPLGVHCEDFTIRPGQRAAARRALQVDDDEVAAMFAGRLTFNGKAHPFQPYQGLEAAARATGRKIVFIVAGQFPTQAIEDAFRALARETCPGVRVLFVDGKDDTRFSQAWRAADFFLSLSDNYQETFGITPVEAMAAGLPVLVTDWDGYKDTVRDGVDGFRIPTWAPAPGAGEVFAADYETFSHNYDFYLSRTSTTVSVEPRPLVERLTALVSDAGLRERMGAAGAARARSVFDWSVVYAQYQALWRQQDETRARRAADPGLRLAAAPSAAPTRLDPFRAFAHYPTRHIGAKTQVRAQAGAGLAAYKRLTAQTAFSFWKAPEDLVERTFAAMDGGAMTLETLAAHLQEPLVATIERVARLAKMELVELSPTPGGD